MRGFLLSMGVLIAVTSIAIAGASEREDWCTFAERWVGSLISEDTYDLYCSRVSEIRITETERLSPRYRGDQIYVRALLVDADGETVYRAAYMTRSDTFECGAETVLRTGTGSIAVSCTPSEPGSHNLYIRAGDGRHILTIVVPDGLPSKREWDDAQLAKLPKAQVAKGRITKDWINYPEFNVSVRNNHTARMTFVEVRFWFYNNAGNPVGSQCGHHGASWWWNTNTPPRGQSHNLVMDDNACLRGASQFEVRLVRADFADGTTQWGP